MNGKKYLVIPFLFQALLAFSQSDSLAVAKADWQTKKISRGIKLKVCSFKNTLFNANQNISLLEIKPSRKVKLDLGYEQKTLKKTSEFGKEADAVAALNGTFFDVKNGGSNNYIRSDGKAVKKAGTGKERKRDITQKAAIVFDKGKIRISQSDGSENWEDNLPGEDIMVTGPALIANHERLPLDSSAFVLTRHPRSAVAIKGKKIFLVTVDGRNENSAGMSLFELANVFKWLKTDYAINLDGGGSTCLWINHWPENGIVNYPSDNKKWDHAGERKVANVILVRSNRRNRD